MKSTFKVLFALELAIGLFPAALGVLIWAAGVLMNLGNEHAKLVDHLNGAVLVLAGGAGLIGALHMYAYVETGSRRISRASMALLAGAGLLVSGYVAEGFVSSGAPLLMILAFSAPLLCGLHLLYVGRSYFSSASSAR